MQPRARRARSDHQCEAECAKHASPQRLDVTKKFGLVSDLALHSDCCVGSKNPLRTSECRLGGMNRIESLLISL